MFMTHSRAQVQGQRSVGSEDKVETNGRKDGRTDGRRRLRSVKIWLRTQAFIYHQQAPYTLIFTALPYKCVKTSFGKNARGFAEISRNTVCIINRYVLEGKSLASKNLCGHVTMAMILALAVKSLTTTLILAFSFSFAFLYALLLCYCLHSSVNFSYFSAALFLYDN